MLSTSATTATTVDPATNAALGAAIANKIAYMKAMLMRGGTQEYVISPIIEPEKIAFRQKNNLIIDNMFHEHTARRYARSCAQKFTSFKPPIAVPPVPVALIASTQLNTTALIGWTFFSFGIISFTILGGLYLFQRLERKRYQNQNDGIIINVTAE